MAGVANVGDQEQRNHLAKRLTRMTGRENANQLDRRDHHTSLATQSEKGALKIQMIFVIRKVKRYLEYVLIQWMKQKHNWLNHRLD